MTQSNVVSLHIFLRVNTSSLGRIHFTVAKNFAYAGGALVASLKRLMTMSTSWRIYVQVNCKIFI